MLTGKEPNAFVQIKICFEKEDKIIYKSPSLSYFMGNFENRKKDVLSKIDKSSIGKWDEKISSLCDKINSLKNYYTTSSCSGRILLMIDQEKKGEGLFVFVSHDKISFKKLKEELEKIIYSTFSPHQLEPALGNPTPPPKEEINLSSCKLSPTPGKRLIKGKNFVETPNKNIKFKFEPCILHIACKTLEDAEKLFEIGKNAGWKRLGIIGTRNGFTFELNSTEKLEFPIIQNGKILVDDNFLKILVNDSNEKLGKSWEKIQKLKDLI